MRRGNVWNVRVAAGLVAVVCLAAGCTGSTEAAPVTTSPSAAPAPPEVPPSPSPSPTPKPSAPTKPKGADEDSTAGAKKALQYFFDVRSYAYRTGDTRPLEKISAPECPYCQSSRERADALREEGEAAQGGRILVKKVEYATTASSGAQVFRFELREEPWEVVDDSGEVTSESGKTRKFTGLAGLLWSNEGWLVEDIDVDGSGKS